MGRSRQRPQTAAQAAMAQGFKRPQPRRISMDRMPAIIDGEVVYPHVGETISVSRVQTQSTMMAVLQLMAIEVSPGNDPRAYTDATEKDEQYDALDQMLEAKRRANAVLASMILSWTLTDMATGKPLPQPSAPDAFDLLTQTELSYLSYAVMSGLGAGASGDVFNPPDPGAVEPAADRQQDEKVLLDSR